MARHVLFIEDDADTREVTAMLLEAVGIEVSVAASFDDARAALARTAFDVVVSDLLVASRDAATAWRRVDELVTAARPAAVGMLSGVPIDAAQRAAHGLAFALMKPSPSEALLGEIAACLELPMLSPAQLAVLRDYFACLEAGAWDRLAALCTDDVVYHLPGDDPRYSRVVRGRAAFRALAAETFQQFACPRFEVTSIRPLGRGAIVRYHGSWRGDGGQRSGLDGSVLFGLDGDRIDEIGVRIDLSRLAAVA